MRKVLIGILVIIPVIILFIVSAVSSIVSVAAYIGVDSIEIVGKEGNSFLSFDLSTIGNKIINLYDYLDVVVLPEKATNKTVEWSIIDIKYLDLDYEESYEKYKNGEISVNVLPAAMLVDDNGNEVETNTSGKMMVNAYCVFTIRATAEQHSSSISCSIYGYDIKAINVVDSLSNRESTLKVSEKIKLYTYVTPLDSIIDNITWVSSDNNIASVDENGVVTAISEGVTTIYAYAKAYSSQDTVFSTKYQITVSKAPSKYGLSFYTHLNELKLSDYGISDAEIISGGIISDGILSITASVAKLYVGEEIVSITKCSENDIIIENAKFLNSDSDEVIEVGGYPLKLKAIYKSVPMNNTPNVIWTSSNEEVAKVDENGVVKGYSSGLVTITARYLDKETVIEVNVQNKVSYLQLYTSNNYYSKVVGGLAREIVYASERYVDIDVSIEKEANYTYIIVKGGENITDFDELKEFYSSYKFEIVEGNRYAFFDEDEVNKLIFTSQLEGKGKQQIVIKVSAKYPKYSSLTSYTQEEVTINAIYGVEVNNIYEFDAATDYQNEYAHKEGNLITIKGDVNYCNNPDTEVKASSKMTYAISFMNDCILPKDLNDKFYSGREIQYEYFDIYGDIYGNNHKYIAYRENQISSVCMFDIHWSNVTVSNLNIRTNELEGGAQITSGDETSDLKGKAISVLYDFDQKYRLLNVNIEYCILENGYQCLTSYNTDTTLNGCILRNVSASAIYTESSISGKSAGYYAMYSRMVLNNIIASNTLGSVIAAGVKNYSIDLDTGKNKFNDDDAINKQIAQEYYDAGFITSVKQTGFFDVYNWQSSEAVNFIQTGSPEADSLISSISTGLILDDKMSKFRYRYKGVDYLDVVGTQFGLAAKGSIILEYFESIFEFEDPRMDKFSLSEFADSSDPFVSAASKLPATVYAYKNDANLTPSSTYVINEKLINKLHG